MDQVVEKGKTLLVEGPASVTVVSGKAETFGYVIAPPRKVVVREGKRLPFAAEEKTTFDISLAEKATIEEVDGNTVPLSWAESYEALAEQEARPAVGMVLGSVDAGKTSLCTYIVNRFLRNMKKVAVLDGDLGQSDIGPPCTISYTKVAKRTTDLFNLHAENAVFIGTTSPENDTGNVMKALLLLKEEMLSHHLDFIIVNSDGWIEGDSATKYKIQLVRLINPDVVFAIQQEDELAHLLDSLKDFKKIIVEYPLAISQRSKEKRKNLRELGYIKYLRNTRVQSFPLGWLKIEDEGLFGLNKPHPSAKEARKVHDMLGMMPLHFVEQEDRLIVIIGRRRWIHPEKLKRLEEASRKKVIIVRKGEEEGLLTGLYNAERRFLGIGVLQEINYLRKTIKILTPVSENIAAVVIGKVKLDKNMREIPAFEEDQPEILSFSKLF